MGLTSAFPELAYGKPALASSFCHFKPLSQPLSQPLFPCLGQILGRMSWWPTSLAGSVCEHRAVPSTGQACDFGGPSWHGAITRSSEIKFFCQ